MSQLTDEFGLDRDLVPAWTPGEGVLRHAGVPVEREFDFFASPAQEIGEVVTAESTLRQGKRAMPLLLRLFLSMAVGMLTLVLLVGGAFALRMGLTVGGALVCLLVPFVLSLIVLAATGFKHHCSYVGTHGMARYTIKGSREAEPREELFLFDDASNLTTSQTRHYTNGIYTGTHYNFNWTDADGRSLFKLSGQYKSKTGNPAAKSPFHFARAGEGMWNNFLIDRLQAELEQHGYVEFKINKNDCVRVGPGFLEFNLGNKNQRLTPEDIKNINIAQGTFQIDTHDARWFSSKGKFRFNYGAMANAQLFLYSLERLLGYQFG